MNLFLSKWKQLVSVKRELSMRDWCLGASGSMSAKIAEDPLLFLITTEGTDKRKRCEEEFTIVNECGEKVFESDVKPPVDTVIHSTIYRETDAMCILHVHTVDNNVISEVYRDEEEVVFYNNEMLHVFSESQRGENDSVSIPIVENDSDFSKLVERYLPHIQDGIGAVLVRNRGLTVWGPDVIETKKWLEGLEFLMSYRVKLLMIQGEKSSVV
ncbi:methylthioribulose 1-phosphate dehydratase [Priestia taiwanensis]|uniref:Methylthioribulose-1-phosphate dehydratase n=1 Tax=Priestia taiwanensis TaxID=1347902 RepID=A0A917AS00_9BACI|nr:methylthioribulose 1-phosphate dehydratase [Priestia taiwanensis]MBM7364013.1 methylthioribulose-1-phosphate dehydratase [Priestia taiwanensis]GGE70979.1 methylthioribulose-1-phosphate dehydratase [Priestia taiwanensis]